MDLKSKAQRKATDRGRETQPNRSQEDQNMSRHMLAASRLIGKATLSAH